MNYMYSTAQMYVNQKMHIKHAQIHSKSMIYMNVYMSTCCIW